MCMVASLVRCSRRLVGDGATVAWSNGNCRQDRTGSSPATAAPTAAAAALAGLSGRGFAPFRGGGALRPTAENGRLHDLSRAHPATGGASSLEAR